MFYKYKVGWYDDYEDTYDVGITFGKTYGEAADNVIKDYGADKVFDVYLMAITMDYDNASCLPKAELDYALERDNA